MTRHATDGTKLPRQGFSGITWIVLAALTLAIVAFVAWRIWFPSVSIIPR